MSIAGNRRPHIGRKWLGIAMWLWAMTVCGAASAADEGLTLAIEQAVRMVVPNGTVVLAAAAAPGPHWTFVNTKGERFTAATPDEMKRMPGVLAPGMKDTDQRLLLVLAEETVFSQLEAAAALPKSAILRLSTATGVYPLHEGPPPVAQLSSKLRVEIGERAAFDEVLAQLDRSLARRGIRIISLEPGAAAIISPRPTIDKMGKPDLIERIDPYRLKDALSGLRGQTLLVTGRLADGLLHFQVSSGPDRNIVTADLVAAAEQHDVNLIILDAAAGRQPGARNWLWLKAELSGHAGLAADSGLDGLLATLATDARPLTVRLTKITTNRATLIAMPGPATKSIAGGLVDTLTRAAASVSNDVTGRIESTAVHLHLISVARERELDRRLIAGLPSGFTWGYLALLIVGALGATVSWRWWNKLWPPENRAEYANAIGYQAARAVKLVAYGALFMPATAIASAPLALVSRLKRSPQPA